MEIERKFLVLSNEFKILAKPNFIAQVIFVQTTKEQ